MNEIFKKIIGIMLASVMLGAQIAAAVTLVSPCRCAEQEGVHEHCETMNPTDSFSSSSETFSKIYLCNCFKDFRRLHLSSLSLNLEAPLSFELVNFFQEMALQSTPYTFRLHQFVFSPEPPYPKS